MKRKLSRPVVLPGLRVSVLALAGIWLLASSPADGQEIAASAAGETSPSSDGGIAARYLSDLGIGKNPDVIFADDFESWTDGGTQPPAGAWSVRKNNTGRTRVVPGQITTAASAPGPGTGLLEIACWTAGSGSQVGGMSRKLGNYNHANEGLGDGYDEVYVRYYLKFAEGYRAVQNHGANLGGRDLTRPDAAWVGMAAIRDVSSRGYFYSGLQPYGKSDSQEVEMGFYSYHLDKKGPWGENYEIQKTIPIRVGQWHCVERRMKLNSVDATTAEANADGAEELWVDGQLSIRKADVRFRRAPHLRITFFSLETYYHGLPKEYDAAHPIRVFVDNVVIARKYVGPMSTRGR